MCKVLLVEDDEFIRRAMMSGLKTIKGIDIDYAIDGEEALLKIKKNKPELILLDIVMPRKDGFTVLKEIRKDKEMKDIDVYVVTNLSGFQHHVEATKLGVKHYFEKANMSLKEIVHSVEKYVRI